MIHREEDGTFSLTRSKEWLPGRYDSERTANYALKSKFPNADLQALQYRKNRENHGIDAVITYEDLQALGSADPGMQII
jgi:hypothetical protein